MWVQAWVQGYLIFEEEPDFEQFPVGESEVTAGFEMSALIVL